MLQPWFLDVEHVLRIHQSLIERYGGSLGVRDVGLLKSAVAMPQASFGGEFLHGSLCEMAAAYLFHLVQNHPFIDGNKRIGVASAIVFLEMNDFTLIVNQEELAEFVLSVARGETDKTQIGIFLEQHGHPNPPSVGD